MEKRVQPDRLICIVLPVSAGHLDKCLCRAWIKIDLTEAQADAFQRVCSGLQQAQVQTRGGRYCNSPELALQWLLERIEVQVGCGGGVWRSFASTDAVRMLDGSPCVLP